MPKPTGPENPELKALIEKLEKSKDQNYLALARHLSKARRTKSEVNLDKISKDAKDNEKIVVPSKVLGNGNISKPLVIYAWQFSKSAKEKIIKAGGKPLGLSDFLKEKTAARMIV
ncbi:MAG: 50S ribosomal protein L18e [Candidatus Aenigmarchaeota archaeon]|nr:50S ribosomal protein L18e [Candidatus Aenigmarchaeota archaeon]